MIGFTDFTVWNTELYYENTKFQMYNVFLLFFFLVTGF